jgi:dihydropteroate synthase
MDNFRLKELKNTDLKTELESIGFDKSYLHKAVDKYQYKSIKIFDLTLPQANILKQTAISVGADCGIHREVLTSKVEKTDCILGGSFSQLKKISQKLRAQPFKLAQLAELIDKNLDFVLKPITIKGKVFDFKKPYIVGVINLTNNSFSDGGEFFELDKAKKHLLELLEDGADIIELGAESTKPFAQAISDDNQLEKLLPMLEVIKEQGIKTPISIDTRSSSVAEKCIEHGADIINDVSGLCYDEDMAKTLAKFDVPVIIQHSKGNPEDMQVNPVYENLMDEIFFDLKNKIDSAIEAGIKQENIIVDPGIGFGKTAEHNFEIIKRIEELFSLNCPIMIGVSRKSLLNMKEESNEVKDIFTLALNAIVIDKKVNFIRVHNVKLHKKLIDLYSNLQL